MSHIFKYYTNKWNSFDFDNSNLKDEMSWDDFNKLSKNVKLKLIEINKNKIDNNNSTYTLSTRKEPSGYLSKWYEYNRKLTDIQINLIDEYLKQTGDIDNNRQIIEQSKIEIQQLTTELEHITQQIVELNNQNTEIENGLKIIDIKLEEINKLLSDPQKYIQSNDVEVEDMEKYIKTQENKKQNLLKKKDLGKLTIDKNNEELEKLNNRKEEIPKKINELTTEINKLSEEVILKYKKQDMTKYKEYIKQIEELNIDYADVVNIGTVNELNVRKIIDDLDFMKLFELNARNILKNPPQNFRSLALNKYINCGFADTEYCNCFKLYSLKKFENEKDTKNLERSYDNYNQLDFLKTLGPYDGCRFIDEDTKTGIYTRREFYQEFLGEHEYEKESIGATVQIGRLNLNNTKRKLNETGLQDFNCILYFPKDFVFKEPEPVDDSEQKNKSSKNPKTAQNVQPDQTTQPGKGLMDWFSKKVKQTDFDPLKKDFEQHVISDNERITNLETKLTELTDKLNSFINNNTVKPKHTLNFLNDITNKHNLKHIEPVQKEYYEDDSLESKLKNVLDKRRSDISPDDEFTESDDESEDWGEGLKEIMTKADRPMFVAGLLGELKKDLEDYGIALNLSKDGQSYYLNVFNRDKKNKYGKGIIEAKEIRDKTDEPAQITYTKLKKIYGDSYN